jgi:Na+/proline symporter
VHDFYRRFLKPTATEHHYVWMGRLATVGLFFCSAALTFFLDTAKDAFDIILQIGAGTGLLYLLRWFWWRINAWCEVAAMISSFVVSMVLFILHKSGVSTSVFGGALSLDLPVTIAVTTVCWLIVAFTAPQTHHQTLIDFYRRVRPFGPGWKRIRAEAGLSEQEARDSHENIPLSLVGWVAGCAVVWSGLFTVGNFLYGRMTAALVLLAVFVGAGLVLLAVIQRLWSGPSLEEQPGQLSPSQETPKSAY